VGFKFACLHSLNLVSWKRQMTKLFLCQRVNCYVRSLIWKWNLTAWVKMKGVSLFFLIAWKYMQVRKTCKHFLKSFVFWNRKQCLMLDVETVDFWDTCCHRTCKLIFYIHILHLIFLNVFRIKILSEKRSLYLRRALWASVNIQVCKEHKKKPYM